MITDLNDATFTMYSMKAYDRPNCIMSEYEEDLRRIKYIKRLIRKYKGGGELKERLILNHIIILANTFGIEPSVKLLFYRIDPEDYDVLKTFLLFLNYMPPIVYGIQGRNIISADISSNLEVGLRLRSL